MVVHSTHLLCWYNHTFSRLLSLAPHTWLLWLNRWYSVAQLCRSFCIQLLLEEYLSRVQFVVVTDNRGVLVHTWEHAYKKNPAGFPGPKKPFQLFPDYSSKKVQQFTLPSALLGISILPPLPHYHHQKSELIFNLWKSNIIVLFYECDWILIMFW